MIIESLYRKHLSHLNTILFRQVLFTNVCLKACVFTQNFTHTYIANANKCFIMYFFSENGLIDVLYMGVYCLKIHDPRLSIVQRCVCGCWWTDVSCCLTAGLFGIMGSGISLPRTYGYFYVKNIRPLLIVLLWPLNYSGSEILLNISYSEVKFLWRRLYPKSTMLSS